MQAIARHLAIYIMSSPKEGDYDETKKDRQEDMEKSFK